MTPDEFIAIRKKLDLTTGQLAEKLMFTRRTVQLMETGGRSITARTARDMNALLEAQKANKSLANQ